MTPTKADMQVWQDISTAPRDGTPFYATFEMPMRWKEYKPAARRQGYPAGRWQTMNGYGGWENTDLVPINWRPHESTPTKADMRGKLKLPDPTGNELELGIGPDPEYRRGWNDCIDHLAHRGLLLPTPPSKGGE